MSDLECTICHKRFGVSEEDPDASFSDAVDHARMAHRLDPEVAAAAIHTAHPATAIKAHLLDGGDRG